jgi:hypothetical protein
MVVIGRPAHLTGQWPATAQPVSRALLVILRHG